MAKSHGLRACPVVVCAAATFLLGSCGGGGGTPPPTIASIELTLQGVGCLTPPATASFTALARDTSGNVIAGVAFGWSSSNTAAATIDGNGTATGVALGSTQIAASAGGVQSMPLTLVVCPTVAGPPGGSTLLSGDVEGATERETSLTAQGSSNYRFTFADPFTRSVVFHNPFYANAKNGEAVTVRATFLVEGGGWVEEDWTGYEWIGFCRDFKQQRLSDLVVVTTADGSVVASAPPKLMRNVVGCWSFKGSVQRKSINGSWSSGTIVLDGTATFDTNPGGHPNQYTDNASGRLRVPIAAPLFTKVDWTLVEGYAESGCSHALNASGSETSIVAGGLSAGSIIINSFIDALPTSLRDQIVQLNGSASLVYTANGVSQTFHLPGTVSGPQPDCGSTYESAPGAWLLTNAGANPPLITQLDGTLSGSFEADTSPDSDLFTWSLQPQREP